MKIRTDHDIVPKNNSLTKFIENKKKNLPIFGITFLWIKKFRQTENIPPYVNIIHKTSGTKPTIINKSIDQLTPSPTTTIIPAINLPTTGTVSKNKN